MNKIFTVRDFRENYKKDMHQKEAWNNIKKLCITGFFAKEDIEDTKNNDDFLGKVKDLEFPGGVAIGVSIKDIVPNPESLYGKKVIISGLTTQSYIALYNLHTILKVEVLNDNDKVIETYEYEEPDINYSEFDDGNDFVFYATSKKNPNFIYAYRPLTEGDTYLTEKKVEKKGFNEWIIECKKEDNKKDNKKEWELINDIFNENFSPWEINQRELLRRKIPLLKVDKDGNPINE